MKNRMQNLLVALALLSALNLQPATAFAQGTAFAYQGRLNNNGSPAAGTYDITFTLFATNTDGVAIAGPVTNSAVPVTNGLFTTLVDFGPSVFTGGATGWRLRVSTNGVNSFTTLTPRQQLTPTPYAIYAENASGIPELAAQFSPPTSAESGWRFLVEFRGRRLDRRDAIDGGGCTNSEA